MGRIEIVSTEEDRVYASKRDWQCPDIAFAPIDKHHVISNSKICWSFFFSSSKSSMPPKSCVLKRALRETLRFFPLSRKVVDFPIIPSLSGREECGVYWKELDVLYHRSESDDDEPNEMTKMMESLLKTCVDFRNHIEYIDFRVNPKFVFFCYVFRFFGANRAQTYISTACKILSLISISGNVLR